MNLFTCHSIACNQVILYPLSEGRSGEQNIPTALVLEDSVIACCVLCPPTYIATIYVLLTIYTHVYYSMYVYVIVIAHWQGFMAVNRPQVRGYNPRMRFVYCSQSLAT